MATLRNSSDYKLLQNQVIFMFLDEKNKIFYITKGAERSLRTAFSNHMREQNKVTKDLFAEGKTKGVLPSMYVLEQFDATRINAHKRQIIWTKYFIDHAFTPLDKGMVYFAQNLDESNEEKYQEIKDIDIKEVLSPANRKFEDFGQRRKRSDNSKRDQINFKVLPEEYETIAELAKQSKRSVSAYCREMSLNKHILDFGYDSIREHTKEISELRQTINNIVYAVMNSGECYQVDIDNILGLVNEIYESEHKFLVMMSKDREKKSKEVKKYLLKKE